MTLTNEQSSNKEWLESISNTDLERVIRTAMGEGCIHPSHVFDAVDEILDRLAKIETLVKSIDLTQCAPLPWKSKISLYPIADTGDFDSSCDAIDASEQSVVAKMDGPEYREVELDNGEYDADILAICDSVNAVSEIKKILMPHKKG